MGIKNWLGSIPVLKNTVNKLQHASQKQEPYMFDESHENESSSNFVNTSWNYENVPRWYFGNVTSWKPKTVSTGNVAIRTCRNLTEEQRYISIHQTGGLGNSMFQYGAVLVAAQVTKRTPILNEDFTKLQAIFQLTIPVCHYNITNFRRVYKYQLQYESHFRTLYDVDKNIMMGSINMDYRIIRLYKDIIRKEFTFKARVLQRAKEFLGSRTAHTGTIVGVHVRGTDMNTTYIQKKGHGTPPPSYFHKAMDYFRNLYKNVHFVVCSDDIPWTVRHLSGSDIKFSHNNTMDVDLAILASCDHVIISRGTFSFWAGWLCRGTTVYQDVRNRTAYYPHDRYNKWIAMT
jgi:galactoside 2-L-fucosyltransferase 1/2